MNDEPTPADKIEGLKISEGRTCDRRGLAITLLFWLARDQKDFELRVNFFPDGSVREVFARPFKTGADLEDLLDKFCMAISRALKFGDTLENIWFCMDDGSAVDGQNIFTAVIRGAVLLEREMLAAMAAGNSPVGASQ